jgi:hypothetical protein
MLEQVDAIVSLGETPADLPVRIVAGSTARV